MFKSDREINVFRDFVARRARNELTFFGGSVKCSPGVNISV